MGGSEAGESSQSERVKRIESSTDEWTAQWIVDDVHRALD
jgi:hypothetical protein